MNGEFRLAQQPPTPHFAWVRIAVEPMTQPSAFAPASAFSWLQDAYGADAGTGDLDGIQQEATDGAMYALAALGLGGAVTAIEIRFAVSGTMPGDVKYATAHAVWDAFGQQPDQLPRIEGDQVVFPDL